MSRNEQRSLASLAALVGGILAAILLRDHVLKWFGPSSPTPGIPVPYFGIFVAFMGLLGLCGVNVFAGGPLDKRRDSAAEEIDD